MTTANRHPLPATTPASAPAPVSRARRWRRRRDLLMAFLALAAWFVHFAYLRITLRPTPRPEYWAAQIAALDPPPPGAIFSRKSRRHPHQPAVGISPSPQYRSHSKPSGVERTEASPRPLG